MSVLIVVHVVEKITTLGSAKTTVIEIHPRSKSSDHKSSQSGLLNVMSCSHENNAKSKQIGTDLLHVFVSPSQNEDHVEKLSSEDSP